MNMIILNLKK
uniref:Uncharacterized protein n=1 Tax=Lepeophtheirus salmonis TaxID=72036 RepID=A0A0K2VBW8_LEPSM